MSAVADAADSSSPPLIVFLNSASGGRMGETVMNELGELLPKAHIFNLQEVIAKKWIPEDKLQLFEDVQGVKVLICGGDGTMGWILSCIDRMPESSAKFPVAMMPLGTGNDLARSYGWGGGFAPQMLKPKFLEKVRAAPESKLDRWLLSVMPYEPLGDDEKIKATHIPPTFSVHKYSSAVGMGSAGENFGVQPERPRTQQVLRMGRSFSTRLSTKVKAVHDDEMNRSSSRKQEAGSLDSSLKAKVAPTGAGSVGVSRASSAPSQPLPTVGETDVVTEMGVGALKEDNEEKVAEGTGSSSEAKGEAVKGSGEGSGNAANPGAEPTRRPAPPKAMPSISVIRRFETWESYDAVFCNYFSFGVDAVAASAFHAHRRSHPELFTSRFRNQMWYARKGFPAAGGVPCSSTEPPPDVSDYLDLRIRRKEEAEWENVTLARGMRGVVVLNLQSYGGGRNLWGSAEGGCASEQFVKAASDDKLLEIVGISSIYKLGCIMGLNRAGVRGHRLCQAAELELRIKKEIHMQIDGEPWLQAPSKINIQHFGQSTCLIGE